MSEFRATVGPLSFEGGQMYEGFSLESISGWLSAPDIRRESAERQQAHGNFPAPGFLDQRLIVLEGKCFTNSAADQRHLGAQMSGLLTDGQYGRINVTHNGQTLWADVGLYTQEFDITLYGRVAEYQIQFVAPDPRRYGETRTFGPVAEGGEVLVHHRGNARAYPRFKVTAAGTMDEGWAVYGPGSGLTRKRFKVNGNIAAGQSNDINLLTGEVTIGNVRRRGVIEDATTWGIPGGTRVSHLLDTNGDGGTLTAYITDTYT